MAKLRVLGSGTSTGVPTIGCNCEVCSSSDVKDRRLRTSVLFEDGATRILLDCGPDFRQQILPLSFKPIDALLISHEHFDHVGGIDDLRAFTYLKELPIYTNKETALHLRERMPYCFVDKTYPGIPKLALNSVSPYQEFYIGEVPITPITIYHGKLSIFGYRVGSMAYITDMLSMPNQSYNYLRGLDILIINALRWRPHKTHQSLEQAIDVALKIGAKKTYFVHMSHDIGLHAVLEKKLPANMYLAYDGLELAF